MRIKYPNDRFVLPIDRMELQSNPAMKQNPGYQEYSTTTDIETEASPLTGTDWWIVMILA